MLEGKIQYIRKQTLDALRGNVFEKGGEKAYKKGDHWWRSN